MCRYPVSVSKLFRMVWIGYNLSASESSTTRDCSCLLSEPKNQVANVPGAKDTA